MNNHYNKNLRDFSRELRTESISKAEKFLWKAGLRSGKMGVKFKRQRPILNFIVDFFSSEVELIIEIDGSSHRSKGNYDRYRQNKLEQAGYKVLRFQEGEVLNNYTDVDKVIRHTVHVLRSEKMS